MAQHMFWNDPHHWRERAEHMRRLAEDVRDATSKEQMLKAADDYERLAQRAEERAANTAPADEARR